MVERAPAGVHHVFAPFERVCASCGAHSLTAARTCPSCGAPYVSRRVKPLGTPRRRRVLAAAIVVLAALVAGGVVLLSPGINRAKRAHATALQRANAAATAAMIARETAQQQLQLAAGAVRDPGAGSPVAVRLAARSALVRELQSAITANTRARVRAGVLVGPVLFTSCSPYPADAVPPQRMLATRVGSYDCLAVNRPVISANKTVGELGDPIWARIDFARGRFAWCKINPRPGEEAVGGGMPVVRLAQACDLSQPTPAALG